jgi:hypothetical protein
MMAIPERKQLALLMGIESGLKTVYEIYPDLTDSLCELALDNAKNAVKHEFGYAANETVAWAPNTKAVIGLITILGKRLVEENSDITLKDFLTAMEKVKRSVARHLPRARARITSSFDITYRASRHLV